MEFDYTINQAIERAILGGLLAAADAATYATHYETAIRAGINASDFTDPRHIVIWNAISATGAPGADTPAMSDAVIRHMTARQDLDTVGGYDNIADIFTTHKD